jgi:diguanylate cyclase (GGDEF)-like protein
MGQGAGASDEPHGNEECEGLGSQSGGTEVPITRTGREPVKLATPKSQTISILLVEDDGDDALLVREMLEDVRGTEFEVHHGERLADACASLEGSPPDCILLDLSLPDARWLDAPNELTNIAPDVPVVILSGLEDELLAVRAVQDGAQDYLLKTHADVHLLRSSIRYAIERKRVDARKTHDLLWDSLTGLPNRALFLDRLSQALVRQKQRDWPLTVLLVDLEGLRLVNRSAGRSVGDELLTAVAGRLRGALRERDTVARLSGDKFGVICENTTGAGHRTKIVSSILERIEAPFLLEDHRLFLDARIGIAVGTSGDEDPEELLRDAQAAVQLAKEQGTPSELADRGTVPVRGHA